MLSPDHWVSAQERTRQGSPWPLLAPPSALRLEPLWSPMFCLPWEVSCVLFWMLRSTALEIARPLGKRVLWQGLLPSTPIPSCVLQLCPLLHFSVPCPPSSPCGSQSVHLAFCFALLEPILSISSEPRCLLFSPGPGPTAHEGTTPAPGTRHLGCPRGSAHCRAWPWRGYLR